MLERAKTSSPAGVRKTKTRKKRVVNISLPAGNVTFLFTDIEGSTRLLRERGAGYAALLAEHRRKLRAAFDAHQGVEFGTEGDAFFVAFEHASDALAAAVDGQRAMQHGPVRV